MYRVTATNPLTGEVWTRHMAVPTKREALLAGLEAFRREQDVPSNLTVRPKAVLLKGIPIGTTIRSSNPPSDDVDNYFEDPAELEA